MKKLYLAAIGLVIALAVVGLLAVVTAPDAQAYPSGSNCVEGQLYYIEGWFYRCIGGWLRLVGR